VSSGERRQEEVSSSASQQWKGKIGALPFRALFLPAEHKLTQTFFFGADGGKKEKKDRPINLFVCLSPF
jgi:hypothetical protein